MPKLKKSKKKAVKAVKAKKVVKKVAKKPVAPSARQDKKYWLKHRIPPMRALYNSHFADPDPRDRVRKTLGKAFGVKWKSHKGERILDIGAGPYPASLLFEEARVVLIEPLAEDYAKWNRCAHLDPRVEAIHATPAEELIPSLVGGFDLVWCHGMLRNCYDWPLVVGRIGEYLKPDGDFFLATTTLQGVLTTGMGPYDWPASPDAVQQAIVDAGLVIDSDWVVPPPRTADLHEYTAIGHKD